MRREAKSLLDKSVDSLTVAIEHFNRPSDTGRITAVLIMFDHAFEMLLKAAIVQRGGQLRQPGDKHAIGFDKCLRIALSDGSIQFLTEDQALTLQAMNGLRDAAQHHLLDLSEEQLYVQAQAGMTLYRDILRAVFGKDLHDRLPRRVLPLSTLTPTDIHVLFDLVACEILKLLSPGSRRGTEAKAKLRPLAILDAAIRGEKGQPSDLQLKKLAQELKKGKMWHEVFPGVAAVELTSTGSGPTLDLRLTKKSGVEVNLVPEGTADAAVIGVKRVNELDYYNLGRDQLAAKLGITGPRTSALVWHLKIKENADLFKQIKIGASPFDRYSQDAVDRIKSEIGKLDVDEVWKCYNDKVIYAKRGRGAAKNG